MAKLTNDIVRFAANNTKPYEQFCDYYRHYSDETLGKNIGAYDKSVSFAEKETKMNEAMFSEIERVSGVKRPENISDQFWASNPNFKWATFAVVTMMIEAILPDTVVKDIGLYTEMRNVGFGDVPQFKVPARSLMTVSHGANAQRTTMIQKQYKADATIPVYNHVITTSVDLYKVLAGRQSLAEFATVAVRSIETKMTVEAYKALIAGIDAESRPAALKISGAFDMEKLVKLCQTVGAYNFGMKPIIAGTTVGLMKVMPDSAAGYRINTNADNMDIQLIKTAFGYDFMVLPQVATGDYSKYDLVLDDSKLIVLSPASDKLVKCVLEGAVLTNSNDYYENADLTSNYTINKRYGFEFLSGAVAGEYNITG